ncbi:MAG TPA: tetratricopeptide repeat protein [Pyrinomonadaceae bacterium]|nr:tetratricopeptide repeat protein [Pyrinomonadaceae bacterium]
MNLTRSNSTLTESLTTDHAAQVWLSCQTAKQFEEAGDYEAARAVLRAVWPRMDERPQTNGLDQAMTAEVLLRAGSVAAYLGSTRQIAGAAELAKDLLSESVSLFASLHDTDKTAEARTALAQCYWLTGAHDEARALLDETLRQLGAHDGEQKALTLLCAAIVEASAARYADALQLLTTAAPIFAASNNHVRRGRYHAELGIVLDALSATAGRQDYTDRALLEYTAASFHFEQVGHARYRAGVENNLGFLLYRLKRCTDAHEHLQRARELFAQVGDGGSAAQVDETRARVLLAEGRNTEAEALARAAVGGLEHGGQQGLLAEALTTQATALARVEQFEQARLTFARAFDTAERAGELEGAGRAELTLLEELTAQLTLPEAQAHYLSADELLARAQDPALSARLRACARRVIEAEQAHTQSARLVYVVEQNAEGDDPWAGFSLKEEVQHFEEHLIEQALKDAQGRVSHAARMLGFRHHETLNWRLKNRNKNLADARKPIRPRRRSIIRNYERKRA